MENYQISELKLSARTKNGLMRTGIKSLHSLVTKNEDDLARIHGFGRGSIQEAMGLIEAYKDGNIDAFLPGYVRPLSARANNALARAGIFTDNQIMDVDEDFLMALPHVGTKTIVEIMSYKESRKKELMNGGEPVIDASFNSTVEHQIDLVAKKREKELIKAYLNKTNMPLSNLAISKRTYNALLHDGYSNLSEVFEASLSELQAVRSLGKGGIAEIQNALKTYIDPIKKRIEMGEITEDNVSLMSIEDVQTRIIEILGKEQGREITFKDVYGSIKDDVAEEVVFNAIRTIDRKRVFVELDKEVLRLKFPHVEALANEYLVGREKEIIIARLKGQTLLDVGSEFGITRERVRQIQKKSISKLRRYSLKAYGTEFFHEEEYRHIYETYNIDKNSWVICGFGNNESYIFLQMTTQKGEKSIDEMGLDEVVPSEIKERITALERKGALRVEVNRTIDEEATRQFHCVLKCVSEHYRYGLRFKSPIEMAKLRKYYEEDNGEQCMYDDRAIIRILEIKGIEYKGKMFVFDEGDVKKLKATVEEIFNNGVCAVFYEPFFLVNEAFLRDMGVFEKEMLCPLFRSMFAGFWVRKKYIACDDRYTRRVDWVASEIMRVWGEAPTCRYDELKTRLPYVPYKSVVHALGASNLFVWSAHETYARSDKLILTHDRINEIRDIAFEKCAREGKVTLSELPLEDAYSLNPDMSITAVNEIIYQRLSDSFFRRGNVLTTTFEKSSSEEMLRDICLKSKQCSLSHLEDFMMSIEGRVRHATIIDIANKYMTRVNADLFVDDDTVDFKVEETDRVLDDCFAGVGIGMKEIVTFAAFPTCNYPWNHYLLESFCRRYSYKYKYVCLSPNSNNVGIITKKECVRTYHEMMAFSVGRASVSLNKESVYDYLITAGYLIRRKYRYISELIEDAKKIREGGADLVLI